MGRRGAASCSSPLWASPRGGAATIVDVVFGIAYVSTRRVLVPRRRRSAFVGGSGCGGGDGGYAVPTVVGG